MSFSIQNLSHAEMRITISWMGGPVHACCPSFLFLFFLITYGRTRSSISFWCLYCAIWFLWYMRKFDSQWTCNLHILTLSAHQSVPLPVHLISSLNCSMLNFSIICSYWYNQKNIFGYTWEDLYLDLIRSRLDDRIPYQWSE